jgi:hypothetical protein
VFDYAAQAEGLAATAPGRRVLRARSHARDADAARDAARARPRAAVLDVLLHACRAVA